MLVGVRSISFQNVWLLIAFGSLLAIGVYSKFFARKRAVKSIGWRPVPQPLSLPIVKNLWQLDMKEPLTSMNKLASTYRDCVRIEIPGSSMVIINSHRLYDEVCNTKRFHKEPMGALKEARKGGGDGLFTAYTHEESWGVAHRILTPVLSQIGVPECFEEMYGLTTKLVERWTFLGPTRSFNLIDDLSMFALDVIAECAFDYPLHAFEQGGIHPLARAMSYFLSESGKRALRPVFVNKYLLSKRDQKWWDCIAEVHDTSRRAIDKRKSNDKKKNDIVNAMLYHTDPRTGRKMEEDNMMYNTLSLFGAGYLSVGSMLAWTLIMLIKHPRCLETLRQELDKVLQGGRIAKDHVNRLPYLTACIRETVRLYPGAPAHNVILRDDAPSGPNEGLGEENYRVTRDDAIRVNLVAIHRDPDVYGHDADQFKPERMMEDNFNKLPRNAWKPFGNGVRGCIGTFFALQEAHIVIATLVQSFDFTLLDDRCNVRIGETFTLVPVDCAVSVTRRETSTVCVQEKQNV